MDEKKNEVEQAAKLDDAELEQVTGGVSHSRGYGEANLVYSNNFARYDGTGLVEQ